MKFQVLFLFFALLLASCRSHFRVISKCDEDYLFNRMIETNWIAYKDQVDVMYSQVFKKGFLSKLEVQFLSIKDSIQVRNLNLCRVDSFTVFSVINKGRSSPIVESNIITPKDAIQYRGAYPWIFPDTSSNFVEISYSEDYTSFGESASKHRALANSMSKANPPALYFTRKKYEYSVYNIVKAHKINEQWTIDSYMFIADPFLIDSIAVELLKRSKQ